MGVKLMYVFALPDIYKSNYVLKPISVHSIIRNVCIGSSMYNVIMQYLNSFLSLLNQKLDFSFSESFIYNKSRCFLLFYKF